MYPWIKIMFVCELALSPNQCIFAGAEIGSTGVKVKWSLPWLTYVIRSNKLNANSNAKPEVLALAA